MNKIWRNCCRAFCLTTLALTAHTALAADSYPDHPIRLISPYEPGGGVDIVARMVAKYLTESLHKAVVVENRPGAGGVVGTQGLVAAAPDGYTLALESPAPLVVAPYLIKNLNYDAQKDLTPISLIAVVPAVLLVKNNSPIHSVNDLLTMAREHPGKLTFSSSGIGGTAHLSAELLDSMAHINLLHVPYKGTAPAIEAVLSGDVTMTFADMTAGLSFVKGHQLRAVAVTSPKRTPALPDIPTVAQTVPGYQSTVWYALFAPKGTPAPIVEKLNREMVKFVQDPKVRAFLANEGAEAVGSTPDQLRTFMAQESARWGGVLKSTGSAQAAPPAPAK